MAFQTWIGAGDSQVLIDLATGEVLSVDHGECFGTVNALTDPTIVATDIPGVRPGLGKTRQLVDDAVDVIEAIQDSQLLEAVAGVPMDAGWNADRDRRLTIAEWLSYRRDRVRGVMHSWTP